MNHKQVKGKNCAILIDKNPKKLKGEIVVSLNNQNKLQEVTVKDVSKYKVYIQQGECIGSLIIIDNNYLNDSFIIIYFFILILIRF